MKEELDSLDRKILQQICGGVYSYDEIAKSCNAGRNTIYRRIEKLEETGVITKRIGAFPNFEKLNLSAVIVGMNVRTVDIDSASNFLKAQNHVKFLWKTYGTHDLLFVMICDKSNVGESLYELKKELEESGIHPKRLDASTSISWDKTDLAPF